MENDFATAWLSSLNKSLCQLRAFGQHQASTSGSALTLYTAVSATARPSHNI